MLIPNKDCFLVMAVATMPHVCKSTDSTDKFFCTVVCVSRENTITALINVLTSNLSSCQSKRSPRNLNSSVKHGFWHATY